MGVSRSAARDRLLQRLATLAPTRRPPRLVRWKAFRHGTGGSMSAGKIVLVWVAVAALGIAAPPVRADGDICMGYFRQASADNLQVPAGATCWLDGTEVRGNLWVEADATLEARGARIAGNVGADRAATVNIAAGSVVAGNIDIRRSGSASVIESRVNGNIHFADNFGDLEVSRNEVRGNLQIIANRGELRISRNRIAGNLQCEGNRFLPAGHRNLVSGNKDGDRAPHSSLLSRRSGPGRSPARRQRPDPGTDRRSAAC